MRKNIVLSMCASLPSFCQPSAHQQAIHGRKAPLSELNGPPDTVHMNSDFDNGLGPKAERCYLSYKYALLHIWPSPNQLARRLTSTKGKGHTNV